MSKLQTPLNHSSNDGTKLITFRAPNSIVNDFDLLIKFKRRSRTSCLVGFMDHFKIVEHLPPQRACSGSLRAITV